MIKRPFIVLFVLTLAGLIFSGYLSAVKFFTNTCAFGETCPYFLGYPACWYGFAMYLLMFVITLFAVFGKLKSRGALIADFAISFLGILFAGSFVVQEIAGSAITGMLGLSTCAYGLIFYILIFLVSIFALIRKPKNNSAYFKR